MNTPLAELVAEHRVLARVVRTLEHWALSANRLRLDDRTELMRFTDFFRGFADDHHHDKEELVLFEAMIERGVPREEGPLGMMFREHEQSRESMRLLVDLARQAHPWTDEDRQMLSEVAVTYSQLLRVHMQKEDEILYPMVLRRMPLMLKSIADEFAHFRVHHTGQEEYRRLLRLGQSLVGRHAPAGTGPLPLAFLNARSEA